MEAAEDELAKASLAGCGWMNELVSSGAARVYHTSWRPNSYTPMDQHYVVFLHTNGPLSLAHAHPSLR